MRYKKSTWQEIKIIYFYFLSRAFPFVCYYKWAKERLGEKKEANSAKRKEATSRRAQRHCDEHPIFGSNSSLVLKWFIFFFFFPLLTKKVIDFVSYSWDFFFFFFSLQKVGQCLFFHSLKRLIATSSERNVLLSFCGIIFVSPFFLWVSEHHWKYCMFRFVFKI